MSYSPKTWVTGETIEATELNHIENGIADSNPFYIVNFTFDQEINRLTTTDTYANIYSQYEAGKLIIFNVMGQLGSALLFEGVFVSDFTQSTYIDDTLSQIAILTVFLNSENEIVLKSGSISA